MRPKGLNARRATEIYKHSLQSSVIYGTSFSIEIHFTTKTYYFTDAYLIKTPRNMQWEVFI